MTGVTFAISALTMAMANFTDDQVLVTKGTDVPLMFTENISSKTAKEGQMVNLKVAEHVTIDGTVVIPQGTPVTAVIEDIDKQGRFGKNARMHFSLNPIMVNGQTIQLQDREKGLMFQGGNTANAAAASVGGAVLLGPLGLLAGWGVVGKPVTIEAGHRVETEVDETVALYIPRA
jgi:hypothetical protein